MKQLTLGILAHVDAGKTTLSEALLYESGAIKKTGRVDHRDAFLDTDSLEKERGITIYSKEAIMDVEGSRIQLLDTPGHSDFSAETERVLSVLDCAILVVSAADSVQSHTRTLWHLLEKYRVPVFIFINKTDQPGTDPAAVLRDLQDEFGPACVSFDDTDSPDWQEETAAADEDLLEIYLEKESLTDDDLRAAIRDRRLFPVCSGSALKLDGTGRLLSTIVRYAQPPAWPDRFGARVYKISRDERGTRLTHIKITGGSLGVRDTVTVKDGNGDKYQEKVNTIRIYNGASYTDVQACGAGTVCAVTGLTRAPQGAALGAEKPLPAPVTAPVLTYRLVPPEGTDPAMFYRQLKEIGEEEPELNILWKEAAQEIQIQVMGEVQTEILASVIKNRLGVDVSFSSGSILYKETVASETEGVGHYEPLRHYAEVHLILSPGRPGSGITFSSAVSEDVLAANWQRLIFTHLQERTFTGVLTGAPLTDVHFTLAAGRASVKHTEGGDFRQATYRAVRQGLMQAENVLLEPYYRYSLVLPSEYTGRAMTDLDNMSAVDTAIEQNGETTILSGEAPVERMRNYHAEVTAYTKGLGRLSMAVSSYRPCHNQEEILAASSYDPDADTDNPSYSVFCSHGAAFYVPWYEVPDYMHIPPVLREEKPEDEDMVPENAGRRSTESSLWISPEEVESIINQTYYANSGKNKRRNSFKRMKAKPAAPDSGVHYNVKKTPDLEKYLLVDGYNVIFAWDELAELARSNIDSARESLLDILCNYRSMTDRNIIAVFDAYKVKNHPVEITDYNNIHVVFTKTAQTADAYIEKFSHDQKAKYDIAVVTSDGLEQIIIRGQGAQLISSHEFEDRVRAVNDRIREILRKNELSMPKNRMDLSALKDKN